MIAAACISAALAATINQTIPNRIAYFDAQAFDVSPIPEPTAAGIITAAMLALLTMRTPRGGKIGAASTPRHNR